MPRQGAQRPHLIIAERSLFSSFVTTGLDPVVHLNFRNNNGRQCERQLRMDCRVKPGNDDVKNCSRDAICIRVII